MLARAPEAERLLGAPGQRLVDMLHGALVEAIVDGRLDASDRLYPGRIAARFGVSPTPVREALMRLAAEGVIRAVPRRGFHVRDPSADEVRDLWQVRRGLETLAAELAVERLRDGLADLGKLRALDLRLAAGARLSMREHVELNGRFHETLIELAGNRLLASLFAAIRMRLVGALIKRGLAAWRQRLAGDAAEHRAIVAALAAHDADAARAAVARHVDRSLADALRDLAARERTNAKPSSTNKTRRRGP
jgi:DNA-binding GntR family transcriptional regulator